MKLAYVAVCAFALMNVEVASAALASYNFEDSEVGAISLGGNVSFSAGLTALGVTSSTLSNTFGSSGQRGVYCNNNQVPLGNTCSTNLNSNQFLAQGVGANGAMNPVGQGGLATTPGVNPQPFANVNSSTVFGAKSFGIGSTGETWTLIFGGSGISSFQYAYNESEAVGFTVFAYDINGNVIATQVIDPTFNTNAGTNGNAQSPCQFANTCATQIISSSTAIYKIAFLDRGAGAIPPGTAGVDGGAGKGDGLQIDNLQVNILGTPEPSTYLMVGSALAALAAFRRRRS